MKNSQLCPKCDSYDIIKIKGGNWAAAQNFIRAGGVKTVFVTRYLCGNCGYSEEWVENPKDIKSLKKKYGDDTSGSQFV